MTLPHTHSLPAGGVNGSLSFQGKDKEVPLTAEQSTVPYSLHLTNHKSPQLLLPTAEQFLRLSQSYIMFNTYMTKPQLPVSYVFIL